MQWCETEIIIGQRDCYHAVESAMQRLMSYTDEHHAVMSVMQR